MTNVLARIVNGFKITLLNNFFLQELVFVFQKLQKLSWNYFEAFEREDNLYKRNPSSSPVLHNIESESVLGCLRWLVWLI